MQPPFDIAADLDTPVSAYLKLGALKPRYLLESVEGGERLARYSFLGFGDGLDLRLDANGLIIGAERRPYPADQHAYLGALRDALAMAPAPKPEVEDLPFTGGLVGVSGYDVVRLFERLPNLARPQKGIPQAAFCATSSVLVFDHLTRRVALLHDGPEAERESLRKEVIRLLRGAVPPNGHTIKTSPAAAGMSEADYVDRVKACKEYIAAGDIYQIVISVLFSGETNLSPFEIYRALRLLNPSPYMFFLEFGDLKIAGSSPEALVRLHDGNASLRPIAGTLPRGATRAEDEANEEALLADPKEAAEHVMLVDLARNDLGRVASAGSVQTGAIDPLHELAGVASDSGLWLHVDGAYGAAGILDPGCAPLFAGIERADSIAVDPHKWLSVPVECGCVLVRDGRLLRDTFSLVPSYIRTERGKGIGNLPWFSEYGFQQTRGFRALKLWATLAHAGTSGLKEQIARQISLARYLERKIEATPNFELRSHGKLSIVCFRYVPPELSGNEEALDSLNKRIMEFLQAEGKVFLTNTTLNGRFVLRACILHYGTAERDVDTIWKSGTG